jgi:peptide deformylase
MIREIITYPSPILKEVCQPVINFDDSLKQLVHDMSETMYAAKGIGLAASQIGELTRIIVVDVSRREDNLNIFVNPEIVDSNETLVDSEEGCLSIPGFRETLKRSNHVKIKAQTVDGEAFEVEAEDLLAICIQHEIDHLNGVLFIDHLSRLKKEIFQRWYKKHGLEKEAD